MTTETLSQAGDSAAGPIVLRWTIARKLYCLLGLLLALFLGVVLFTVQAARNSNRAAALTTDAVLPLLRAVMELNEQKTTQNDLVRELFGIAATNSTDSADFQQHYGEMLACGKKVDQQQDAANEAMNKLQALAGASDAKAERLAKEMADLTRDHDAWDAQSETLLKQLRSDRAGVRPGDVEDLLRRGESLEDHVLGIQNRLADLVQDRTRGVADTLGMLVIFETTLGALAVLGGGALGLVIVRRLNRPITSVTNAAQSIAGGNLNQAALTVQTTDETAVLADAFNRMAASLRTQIQDTKGIIETLSAATTQISASIQEQAASSKEEAATIQEITTTMQEIRQSGADIAGRAGEVAKAADATATASASGLKAVEEGSRGMELIREQVEEVAEHIVALSEKNQAVGQIIASVTEIAEQSHLLAINAAIEAVSAGEQGGRFSVVATEMRNLANQAKESTVQVRTILGDVQKGINTSVMLAEEAVKRVEAAKAQAEATRQTIGDLRGIAQDSAQAFQQIIAGTHQQHIGVEQITQGMNDIRQAAQQTAAGISQLEQAMHNLVTLAQQLRRSLDRYRL